VLDDDKDEFISLSDLGKATFTLESEPILTYLRKNLDDIEEANDDENGDENDGITKADIRSYSPIKNFSIGEKIALVGVDIATLSEWANQCERVVEQIDPTLLQLKPVKQ